jgi:hypothetical protein
MANQGQQDKQGNRDREGNLGNPAGQPGTPTGTSGRQNDTGGIGDNPDVRRNRNTNDDEESGLGNRTSNR